MAVYRVQAPDGSILKIEGPDDARPEEIEAFAAQQFEGGRKAAPERPKASESLETGVRVGPFGVSVDTETTAGMKVAAGARGQEIWDAVKQGTMGTGAILAELLPERLKQRVHDSIGKRLAEMDAKARADRAIYERLREEMPGTTLAGEAAVDMAFPMGRATKGAGVLRQAAEMAVPGAIPGLLTADNQGANAAVSGGATAVGGALVGGVTRALRPVTPRPGPGVNEALALGYQLPAGVRTGSEALQAAEAALESLPGTRRRLGDMAERNRELTQMLTHGVDGGVDQAQAGAAAMRSYNEGVGRVLDESGAQYERLLDGKVVPVEGMRPDVEAIVASQKALPESERAGKAVAAAGELLGTPGYAKKPRQPRSVVVDVQKDDLITAIRKKGGLDYTEFGQLADEMTFPQSFDGPVYRGTDKYGRAQGVSRDRMAEMMANEGYIPEADPDLLVDAIERASKGEVIESAFKEYKAADPLADAISALTAKLEEKSAPKASPGFLRANPEVSGQTAQRMRSSYGARAEAAHVGGRLEEAKAYRGLRDAVDRAIDDALKGSPDLPEFSAIRERYGLAKAIESLKPENQGEFLAKLYRGAKSPDQFYSWLGVADDKGFEEVRRGFLGKILDAAKDPKTGEVSGKRLANALKSADPEAVRVLGQGEGERLKRIAAASPAAEFAFPNSGTGPRTFYQGLFTNPLALYGLTAGGGAALGSSGGSEGAAAGALAGLALPRAAQSAMFSRAGQRYLTEGLVRLTPAERAALTRAGGLAALGLSAGER